MLFKKLVIALLFLAILFSTNVIKSVSAADSLGGDVSIQGLNCGVATGKDGSDKCCYNKPKSLPSVPLIGSIGGYNKAKEQIDKLQEQAQRACIYGDASTSDIKDPSCKCILSPLIGEDNPVNKLCEQYNFKNPTELKSCRDCTAGGGLLTGLGCIPLSIQSFVSNFLLGTAMGLSGVVTLLCIIYSAFILQTARGNPERVKKAREYLTNCIIGLILIIISVFLLKVIGVNILGIPFLQ